jgi:hypothetical protein
MDDVHVHPMSSSSRGQVFLVDINKSRSIYIRRGRPPQASLFCQGYERGQRGATDEQSLKRQQSSGSGVNEHQDLAQNDGRYELVYLEEMIGRRRKFWLSMVWSGEIELPCSLAAEWWCFASGPPP